MVLGPTSASVKTFAVCTTFLYFKFLVTARLQAVNTFLAGGRPPEDNKLAQLLKKKGPTQSYGLVNGDEKDERLQRALIRSERWKRIVANDIESIPLALAVFAAGLLTESNETVQVGAMVTYTAARFVHTYVYAKGMQPHRSMVWTFGAFAIVVGAFNVLAAVAFA
jgi:glutathione S-transferase